MHRQCIKVIHKCPIISLYIDNCVDILENNFVTVYLEKLNRVTQSMYTNVNLLICLENNVQS